MDRDRREGHAREVPPAHIGRPSVVAHALVLAVVGAASVFVLVLTVLDRPEDSAFVYLYEATSILAGDHPYRDFFEWGAPLPAYLSAAGQRLAGYRVIAEVVLQWAFIVAGVMLAFHLGLRLSRSSAATLLTIPVAMLVLANTPTYHYTKLFVFPLALWLGWRYLDRPAARRSAALAVASVVAFFFRHDHGVWVGVASMLALLLGHAVSPARGLRPLIVNAGVYAVVTAMFLLPWIVVVERTEGLVAYVHARAAEYQSAGNPYRRLLGLDALRQLRPVTLPPPRAATVEFVWGPGVEPTVQQQLERAHGLSAPVRVPGSNRVRYELANVYDLGLLELRGHIREESGFDWTRLNEVRYRLPSREVATLWIAQVALVVPVLLLVAAAATAWRSKSRSHTVPIDSARMCLAGVLLAIVDAALFRQPSYVVTVMPLTAAMSARFLAGPSGPGFAGRSLRHAGRVATLFVLIVTTVAAGLASAGVSLFRRPIGESIEAASSSIAVLRASPPDGKSATFEYLRECTAPGDRLLVGGMTPFHVNYYTRRALAGGHLYWHSGWRNDPDREAESLALLQRQSVPFAISSSDPMIEDFAGYPRIRAYLMDHYAELPGSNRRILFDTRRRSVRSYGPEGWPCFAGPPGER